MILAKKKLKCGDTFSVEVVEVVGTVDGCDDPKCCPPGSESEVVATWDGGEYSLDCPEKDLRNAATTLAKAADEYDAYLTKKKKVTGEKRRKK